MPEYQSRVSLFSCPCCNFSSTFGFEKKMAVSLKPPYTLGVYDSLMEKKHTTVYSCLKCGWVLGWPEDDPVQVAARERAALYGKVVSLEHKVVELAYTEPKNAETKKDGKKKEESI